VRRCRKLFANVSANLAVTYLAKLATHASGHVDHIRGCSRKLCACNGRNRNVGACVGSSGQVGHLISRGFAKLAKAPTPADRLPWGAMVIPAGVDGRGIGLPRPTHSNLVGRALLDRRGHIHARANGMRGSPGSGRGDQPRSIRQIHDCRGRLSPSFDALTNAARASGAGGLWVLLSVGPR